MRVLRLVALPSAVLFVSQVLYSPLPAAMSLLQDLPCKCFEAFLLPSSFRLKSQLSLIRSVAIDYCLYNLLRMISMSLRDSTIFAILPNTSLALGVDGTARLVQHFIRKIDKYHCFCQPWFPTSLIDKPSVQNGFRFPKRVDRVCLFAIVIWMYCIFHLCQSFHVFFFFVAAPHYS